VAPGQKLAAPVADIIVKKDNFRYVHRRLDGKDTEQAPPYWLTHYKDTGRIHVLPPNNQGVALMLHAKVAIPKIIMEEGDNGIDHLHLRIVNRKEEDFEIQVVCMSRNPPLRQYVAAPIHISASSMVDLSIDTPSDQRNSLMVRVR